MYQALAGRILAMQNCQRNANEDWYQKHLAAVGKMAKDHLPLGSGFDWGSGIDAEASKPDRLVLYTSFHHMNDVGRYDGRTEHQIIVKPSLYFGFELRVTGPNRCDIKDYIAEVFDDCLRTVVDEYPAEES